MADLLTGAVEIAREAGALLLDFARQRVGYELKGESDLVTVADRASEKLILERLGEKFPGHAVLAEETGAHDTDSSYRWYVDPLDGTTNFAHSFPAWNVTLACEHNGTMLAGVVYDPLRDEMFAAERGQGATLNGERIQVSKAQRLQDVLVATGFPSRKRHQNVNIHFYHQLAMISHGVRRAGAAALDLAYVACGRLDGFWEFGLNPWDMAAGILLVEEAGGRATDMNGEPAGLRKQHLFVSNGHVHDEAVRLFADIFDGKYRHTIPHIGPESPARL